MKVQKSERVVKRSFCTVTDNSSPSWPCMSIVMDVCVARGKHNIEHYRYFD